LVIEPIGTLSSDVQRVVAGIRLRRGADRFDHQRCSCAHLGGVAMVGAGSRTGGVGFVQRSRRLAAAEGGRRRSSVVDPLATTGVAGRGWSAAVASIVGWKGGLR